MALANQFGASEHLRRLRNGVHLNILDSIFDPDDYFTCFSGQCMIRQFQHCWVLHSTISIDHYRNHSDDTFLRSHPLYSLALSATYHSLPEFIETLNAVRFMIVHHAIFEQKDVQQRFYDPTDNDTTFLHSLLDQGEDPEYVRKAIDKFISPVILERILGMLIERILSSSSHMDTRSQSVDSINRCIYVWREIFRVFFNNNIAPPSSSSPSSPNQFSLNRVISKSGSNLLAILVLRQTTWSQTDEEFLQFRVDIFERVCQLLALFVSSPADLDILTNTCNSINLRVRYSFCIDSQQEIIGPRIPTQFVGVYNSPWISNMIDSYVKTLPPDHVEAIYCSRHNEISAPHLRALMKNAQMDAFRAVQDPNHPLFRGFDSIPILCEDILGLIRQELSK